MAQVVGKVEVGLKVPKEERAMPSFWGKLKVATMDENVPIRAGTLTCINFSVLLCT